MSSPNSAFMAIDVIIEQESHLMRLPTEIREMIYRHLLIAKHTMREPNMTTKEYNSNRRSILQGPDQTYQFDTAIFRTNRKIHEEARDLCRRENDFACLTSLRPSSLGHRLAKGGLQMISQGPRARNFWNVSMTLTLDPADLAGWPQVDPVFCETGGRVDASEDGRPWTYFFCSEELPEFCRLLFSMSTENENVLHMTALYLDISPAIGNGQTTEIDSNPAGLSRMEKLVGPLRQLHSFGAAQVQGPLSGSYKGKIISSVCRDCPTVMDAIHTTMTFLDQADEQVSRGQLRQASLGYKAALSLACSCCWRYDEQDFKMNSGPFPGLTTVQNIYNIKVRLQARIAAVYFRSGKLRMARIYIERALDPRRPYDNRSNKLYELYIMPWENVVYAEVLHVAAQISYTQGDVSDAVQALKDARKFAPFNKEQQSRCEAWRDHRKSIRNRNANRAEARRLQSQKRDEKTEGMVLVACNWKIKADRLLRNGRSNLATSTYKGTLSKIDRIGQNRELDFTILSGQFEDYCGTDALRALRFKVQASFCAAYLMSRKYQDVSKAADAALECTRAYRDCTHELYDYCSLPYRASSQDWAEDQKLDYVKIHYCKALALNHMGATGRAVEHMEKALGFDPGDGTVFAQLTLLKQELKWKKDAVRHKRAGKLNVRQDQLRRKQAIRKAKARA